MALVSRLVLLFALLLSVNALATPHIVRRHHALAARAASPVPIGVPHLRKRETRRCKPRPANPSNSSSVAHSSTAPIVNVAPDPATIVKPSSTHVQEPDHTTPPPPPPPPQTTKAQSPETTQKPSPTTTHQPAQTNNGGNSGNLPSFLTNTNPGEGTFYDTGLGACGITNHDSDYIVAVSHLLFDIFPGYNKINPNTNPICGKRVKINFQGKSVEATIVDRCGGCQMLDLDLSPSAFNQIADPSLGRIDINWAFI